MQDKTSLGKKNQDKTRQTRQDKTRQYKARELKTRQDKTARWVSLLYLLYIIMFTCDGHAGFELNGYLIMCGLWNFGERSSSRDSLRLLVHLQLMDLVS